MTPRKTVTPMITMPWECFCEDFCPLKTMAWHGKNGFHWTKDAGWKPYCKETKCLPMMAACPFYLKYATKGRKT